MQLVLVKGRSGIESRGMMAVGIGFAVIHALQRGDLISLQNAGHMDPLGLIPEITGEEDRGLVAPVGLLKGLGIRQKRVLHYFCSLQRVGRRQALRDGCLQVMENKPLHAGQGVKIGSGRNRIRPVLLLHFFLALYDSPALFLFFAPFIFIYALCECPGAVPLLPGIHHSGHVGAEVAVIAGLPAGAVENGILPAVFSAHRGVRYFDKVLGAAAAHSGAADVIGIAKIRDQALHHIAASLGDSGGGEEVPPVLGLGNQIMRERSVATHSHGLGHVRPHIEQFGKIIIKVHISYPFVNYLIAKLIILIIKYVRKI